MTSLKIIWQKGKEENPLAERMNLTYLNLERALMTLTPILLEMGVKVEFEKVEVEERPKNLKDWQKRILIEDKFIEDFLDIETRQSFCLGLCGKVCDVLCKDKIEEIPDHLIIAAVFHVVREKLDKMEG
ncbi:MULTISPECIES: DUF2703 domain-containing protein [Thermodesulfobacterium]|jgi:hypothetical protein|uniref:DUF2703 domain-containing protein n=2 Tax=Thermodesulfobacterium commune TaxID=1741 RepID=A0A075WQB0_9BACT|nr:MULTISPECIES: DUF2703 domain-containing protein [Thermodesulfobacterium]KUJ97594.1 MAG: hypothetical protein XD42_0756 [Thermodesulfobacterium sp. 37_54]KUK19473.1 MAG: hypothetical protein XD55_0468 [Thermodesulfobacterium commune]AIH03524.1 hypothetical protein HL41_01035 [Thermodesulfobacterium commune DSM 2178]KUK38423.1 MAG: hypothetical protein XD67_0264 [Thermodesulfobacterium commune]MBZ4681013.1 hypothetical protein [Thermodesulfobacterium sp.]